MVQVEKPEPCRALSKGAQSILEVAEQLFAEKGFDAVSINDIAQQAEVSKANIFHHFKSKEGLYLAVLKMACNRAAEALDVTKKDPLENSTERMSRFFSSHLKALLEQPRSTRLILRELMKNSEQRGKQLAEEVFAETFSKVVNLVQEAQTRGVVRSEIDAPLLAFLLVGANVFFFETHAVMKHLQGVNFAESPDHYNSAVFELLSHGFASSPEKQFT
jgi:TetR/AcrR family transcriptional regulator